MFSNLCLSLSEASKIELSVHHRLVGPLFDGNVCGLVHPRSYALVEESKDHTCSLNCGGRFRRVSSHLCSTFSLNLGLARAGAKVGRADRTLT